MRLAVVLLLFSLLRCSFTKRPRNVGQRRGFQALKKGDGPHFKKLASATNMLNDPQLEEFRFIPGDSSSGLSKHRNREHLKLPLRHIGILKFVSDNSFVRKIFKVKVKMPHWRKSEKKLRGTLIYPKTTSRKVNKCTWNLASGIPSQILYVPENCQSSVRNILRDGKKKIVAILLPRHKTLGADSMKQLLNRFVLVNYGKRMGLLLEKLAVENKYTRIVLPKRRWQKKNT